MIYTNTNNNPTITPFLRYLNSSNFILSRGSMKVLMPTIYYPYIGGITIHVENLVRHLKDIEFHIITYDYYENEYKNVIIHTVPHLKKLMGISYLINAYRIGKKIVEREEIDLIHSHYAFPQGCVGGLLKNKFSIPHILTLHGSDALILKNSFKGRWFFKYAVKNSDKIICVSKYIKKWQYSGIHCGKTMVVRIMVYCSIYDGKLDGNIITC